MFDWQEKLIILIGPTSAERDAEVTVVTEWERKADATSAASVVTSREIAPVAPIQVGLQGLDQVLIRVGVHQEAEAENTTEKAAIEEVVIETDTAEAEAPVLVNQEAEA